MLLGLKKILVMMIGYELWYVPSKGQEARLLRIAFLHGQQYSPKPYKLPTSFQHLLSDHLTKGWMMKRRVLGSPSQVVWI